MALRNARQYITHNIWKEQQRDGSEKYFAVDPKTRAVIEIDAEQVYFWTDAWQAKEKEADDDRAAGRYADFDDVDDFFDTRIP